MCVLVLAVEGESHQTLLVSLVGIGLEDLGGLVQTP